MTQLTKLALIALAAALVALPALAQSADPRVRLHTPDGDIVLELYADKAPITVRNFLHYVDTKRLDGASFFRYQGNDTYTRAPGGWFETPAALQTQNGAKTVTP